MKFDQLSLEVHGDFFEHPRECAEAVVFTLEANGEVTAVGDLIVYQESSWGKATPARRRSPGEVALEADSSISSGGILRRLGGSGLG